MNTFVKQDIKMSAAMKACNTNLHLPAQLLFDIFEKAVHMYIEPIATSWQKRDRYDLGGTS